MGPFDDGDLARVPGLVGQACELPAAPRPLALLLVQPTLARHDPLPGLIRPVQSIPQPLLPGQSRTLTRLT